jgi:hypothetical protein
VHVSVGLLESHDPAGGRVIVHPTPGSPGPQALAHDLLGALGRPVNRVPRYSARVQVTPVCHIAARPG